MLNCLIHINRTIIEGWLYPLIVVVDCVRLHEQSEKNLELI